MTRLISPGEMFGRTEGRAKDRDLSDSGLHKPQAGFRATQSQAYVSENIYWLTKVTERPMHIPRTEHVRFQMD
jgi:hypothetical protein